MARPIVKYLDPVSGGYEFATVVDIGDLRNLNTTIKSDIVGAINSIISDGVYNPINDEKIENLEKIINSLKDGTFKIDDFGSIDEYLKQQFLDELDKINAQNRTEMQSVLTQLDTSVDDAIRDYQEKVAAQNIILENAENTLTDARDTLEAKAAELETAKIGLSELKTEFNELDNYISTNVRTIDFDNFNAMVEDYETVVTQTSDKVGVDMSGSTLSYLTGRVSDAEANISAQAGEISSKMSYDEFQYMPIPKYSYGENLLFDTFDFGDAWSGKNGAQVTPDTFLFGKVVAFNSPTGLYETRTDDLTIGESYVLSTYVNVQPSEKSPSQDKYEPISKSYDPTDFKVQIGGKSFNPVVYEDLSGINGWVRINQEFVADAVNPIISITPSGVNSQNEVAYMAMPKVEKGLTVTPWQPHVKDSYATLSSTQSMIKQQANSIIAFITEVSELDDSYRQATSTFKMLADGFAANTEAIKAYEDAVTRYGTEYSNINGKFEQKVWKDDFKTVIEDINIDNRNRVLNSDFIRSEISSSDRRLIVEDWSINSDWEIKTIDNNEYLSRSRTGLAQNLITSASSNYFPVRDGERILFGFDLIHSGLDNDRVFAIELFDINNKRLLKQQFSLSSLTKVSNRYHGSFSISTPGAEKGSVVLQIPRNGSVSFTKISFQNADIGSVDWNPAPEDSWIIQSKLATYISQVEDEITIGGTGQKIDTLTGLLTEDKGTFTLNPDKIATEVLNSQTYDDMGFVNKTNFEQTADGWMQEITSEGRLAGYINASPDTYRISFDKIMLEGTTWADALGSSKITVTENFALMGQNGRPVLDVNNDGSINMNVTSLKIGAYNVLTTDDKGDIEAEVTDNVIRTTEPYVHIAYADTEDGQGISFNPSGKQYIGFAKSHLPTPSGTASNYTWSKYVGDAGKDGVVGKDGVGIKSTTITYGVSANETTQPATYTSTVPTLVKGQYLWTKTVWVYTDNTTETGYTKTYIPKDGNDGTNGLAGKDGVGIQKTVIDYATSSSGTVRPSSGWTTSVPSVTPGNYLWTRTVWTYTDNDVETGYSVSRIGKDGAKGDKGDQGPQGIQGPSGSNGQSQWVHIRYSPNPTGAGMTTSPSSTTKYVGIAVTNSATAPAFPEFTWSKYVGEDGSRGPQGLPGDKGTDGKTTYTWIRYADTPTSGMNQYPDGKKYIGLAFNKTTQTESDNYNDYKWSLFKGRDSDEVIKVTTPSYPLTTPYTQQNGIVFPTIYGNTKHSVPVGAGRNLLLNTTNTLKSINTGIWFAPVPGGGLKTLSEYGVKVGDTIRFAVYIKSTVGNGGSARISLYKADNTYTIVTGNDIKEGAEGYSTVTVQISSDIVKLVVAIQNTVGTGVTASTVQYKEEMMTKSNEEYPYTPAPEDIPQNLLSVGNEVELVSSVGRESLTTNGNFATKSLNGWNVNGTVSYESVDGLDAIKLLGTNQGFYQYPNINSLNDIMTISFKAKSVGSSSSVMFGFLNDGAGAMKFTSVSNKWETYSFTTTKAIPSSRLYHFYANGAGTAEGVYITDIKLEVAAGPSPYSLSPTDISYDTPHPTIYKTNLTLPQPLRSVGDVKDKLFRDSDGVWKIERRVAEKTFNNSNGWAHHSQSNTEKDNYETRLVTTVIGYSRQIISNRFIGTLNQNAPINNIRMSSTGYLNFAVKKGTINNLSEWFSQNPFTILYEEVPTIEILDKPLQDKLNSLPTYSPETWVYTVNNNKTYLGEEVAPEMEGEFWGAGWAANFRIENNIIPNIDNKAESEALNSLIQTVTTESEKLSSIATDVEVTKNNFLITHTDEYVNKITTTESSIEGLESRIVSVEETKENVDTFFQFDDAFTIGKSNAQTKLRMTNDEIQFLDGETKGTYITGNTMVSQNIQIQDKLNLPKHTFETEGDITVVRYIG